MPAEYYSCEWLEGGLAFSYRSLHTCLIVHRSGGFPRLIDYCGGDIPVEHIVGARQAIIAQNQAGGCSACSGCPLLKKQCWKPTRYAFELVGISHFCYCNLHCCYCYLQNQDPRSFELGYRPYPILPVMRHLIVRGQLAPRAVIDWGGGEPLLYSEFEELLALLNRFGCTQYVNTNGTSLPATLAGLETSRIHIICSIDAGYREIYRVIKGVDALEAVWQNLAEYRNAGCSVIVKYVAMEQNCEPAEMREFVRRARKVDAPDLIVDLDYNIHNPSQRLISSMLGLLQLAKVSGIRVSFGFVGSRFQPDLFPEWARKV